MTVRRRAALAAAVAGALGVAGAAALAPGAATAHPFGPPQTVRLSAAGSQVTLWWTAAPDDLIALGGAVGALPERRELVFEPGADGDPEPVSGSDSELLAVAPELVAYLESHLAVRQDGGACRPQVSLDRLAERGARVDFVCSEPVARVEIEVTMLTDLHESYRTAAVGDGTTAPDRALYTVDDTVRTWSFGSAEAGRSWSALAWAIGCVAPLGASTLWWWGRRRLRSR